MYAFFMADTRQTLTDRLSASLANSRLPADERVLVAAHLFVTEALFSFWERCETPLEAHELLRSHEPEIADAIEALAPMLLRRLAAAEEAAELVALIEQFVASPSR